MRHCRLAPRSMHLRPPRRSRRHSRSLQRVHRKGSGEINVELERPGEYFLAAKLHKHPGCSRPNRGFRRGFLPAKYPLRSIASCFSGSSRMRSSNTIASDRSRRRVRRDPRDRLTDRIIEREAFSLRLRPSERQGSMSDFSWREPALSAYSPLVGLGEPPRRGHERKTPSSRTY